MLARLFSKLIGRGDREAVREDREAAPQVRIVITGGERIDPKALAESISRFNAAGLGTFL